MEYGLYVITSTSHVLSRMHYFHHEQEILFTFLMKHACAKSVIKKKSYILNSTHKIISNPFVLVLFTVSLQNSSPLSGLHLANNV